MAGIKDVADLAGVSISTVSNTLNGTKSVSNATRKKVLSAARKLNYEADGIARSMKSQHSKLVGVIIPSISRVFFPQVISGIQAAADEAGYTLLLYSSEDSFENEREQFARACKRGAAPKELLSYQGFFTFLQEQRIVLEEELEKLTARKQELSDALVRIYNELKVLENMRQEQYQQYLKEVAMDEAKELDSIISFSIFEKAV